MSTKKAGDRVQHRNGTLGTIIGFGFSPAGIPNYAVATATGTTWWYRSDVR